MAEQRTIKDVVVVVPGILGSRLSKDGRQVWGASAGALVQGLLSFGKSIKQLTLPDGLGDNDPEDGVVATALMNDLHVIPGVWDPVCGYSRLLAWLHASFDLVDESQVSDGRLPNLVPFAYDWRLSNRLNARRLQDRVEPVLEAWKAAPGHEDAKLVFLCHSMGGLVARYYLECLGGASRTRALVTFGTPHRGALKALKKLVDDEAMGWWKFRIDLSALVRSLPTSYQLLPTYGCIGVPGEKELKRLNEVNVPGLDRQLAADGLRFHDEMRKGASDGSRPYTFDAVVGIEQPTDLSATFGPAGLTIFPTMEAEELTPERGDGTVPRFSAAMEEPGAIDISRVWRSEQHGWLQVNAAILDHVSGVLTRTHVQWRDAADAMRPTIGLEIPEVAPAGRPIEIGIVSEDDRLPLQGVVRASGSATGRPLPVENVGGGRYLLRLDACAPGAYEIQVGSPFEGITSPTPVTGGLLVWDPDLQAE